MTATDPTMSAAAESRLPYTGGNQEEGVAIVTSRPSPAWDRPALTTENGRSGCRVETEVQLEAFDGAYRTEEGAQPW